MNKEIEIAKKELLRIIKDLTTKHLAPEREDVEKTVERAKLIVKLLKKTKYKERAEEIIPRLEGNQVRKAKKLTWELYLDLH